MNSKNKMKRKEINDRSNLRKYTRINNQGKIRHEIHNRKEVKSGVLTKTLSLSIDTTYPLFLVVITRLLDGFHP